MFNIEQFSNASTEQKYAMLHYICDTFIDDGELMPCHYVYCIRNEINRKIYVGYRNDKATRTLWSYAGSGSALPSAYAKYGMHNFTKSIVYIGVSSADIMQFEGAIGDAEFIRHQVNGDDACYNRRVCGSIGWTPTYGSKHPMFGRHFSEQAKENMAAAQRGKKHRPRTDEEKRKIGAAHKNKIVSEETRMKQRMKKLGKPKPTKRKL